MTKLYDPQCEDLARYYLEFPIDESLVAELAGVIQQAIEDWDQNRKAELPIPGQKRNEAAKD